MYIISAFVYRFFRDTVRLTVSVCFIKYLPQKEKCIDRQSCIHDSFCCEPIYESRYCYNLITCNNEDIREILMKFNVNYDCHQTYTHLLLR